MIVVWGKKLVYRELGFVADFCPICRTAEQFTLRRVGLARHLYYVAASEGDLLGFERTCQSCETVIETDGRKYPSFSPTPAALPELKALTYPDMDADLGQRFELEARVSKNPSSLSAAERATLIQEPFVVMSPKVEVRYAGSNMDKEVGLSLVGAFFVITIGAAVAESVFRQFQLEALIVVALLAVGLIVWQMQMSKRRFLQRQIVPVLAKALAPLQPTESELKAAIASLGKAGHKIGKLKLVDLQEHLPTY